MHGVVLNAPRQLCPTDSVPKQPGVEPVGPYALPKGDSENAKEMYGGEGSLRVDQVIALRGLVNNPGGWGGVNLEAMTTQRGGTANVGGLVRDKLRRPRPRVGVMGSSATDGGAVYKIARIYIV